MIQEVRQWIDEIQTLQQKLAQMQQERDEALASANQWRQRYEAEAQQRRAEACLAQQQIQALNAELQQADAIAIHTRMTPAYERQIQQQVQQVQNPEALKEQLVQALVECDRLSQALKQEQTNHAETRQSLTATLGDTVDRLAQARKAQQEQSQLKTISVSHELALYQPES
ncbi:MAG: hypothetical protein MUF49_01205 [Oculatellaceae cyanobacterium Prado106]|jgi:galactitol-specific phosphotransferase system IIB component|nr:hypothetical protein [Oculatellaceae cyanobacterium Prado106]